MFYRADKPYCFAIGRNARVYPLDHPDTDLVTGDGHTPAITSPVVAVNTETGEFWTMNTHYAPLLP